MDKIEKTNETVDVQEEKEETIDQQPLLRMPRRSGWESLEQAHNKRKNELIDEIYQLHGDDNEEAIKNIKAEWNTIHEAGTNERLERRFEEALDRQENSQERMDEAIALKKDLIHKAEQMKESTRWNKTAEKYKDLQEEWRTSGYAGEPENEDLWKEFQAINDYFFNRRKEHFAKRAENIEKAAVIKAELVEKAKELTDSTQWKETSHKMHGFMDEWKAAGFAGRGTDDELWEKFNGYRQNFFQRQNEFFENLRREQKEAFDVKTKLIEKAEELKHSLEFDETRVKMENLMKEWKEAGYAGRKHDNDLWEAFQGARDHFYSNMHDHNTQNREDRREEIDAELELANAQIDSLEKLNETIYAKLESVQARQLPSEDHEDYEEIKEELDREIAELNHYLDENNKSLDEEFDKLDRLNDELDKFY